MLHDRAVRTTVAGEELVPLPDRAVYWPSRATLLVADPHFGKAAAFRFADCSCRPAPRRAVAAVETAGGNGRRADRVPGDFLHAAEGRSLQMFGAVAAWRRSHAAIGMTLVRAITTGAPEIHQRNWGSRWGCAAVEGPLALAHHPVPVEGHYVLAGHIHPCAKVRGAGRQSERLACFWFGREAGVLPAFGSSRVREIAPISGTESGGGWFGGDRDGRGPQ
jgi:metallophosphoesterase superfamily enzyme